MATNGLSNGVNGSGHSCPEKKPNKVSGCTWRIGTTEKSPHTVKAPIKPKILPDILYAIGNTPMVKLNRIPQAEGIKCDMYAKVEFFNPGGSVKDRIGYRMVLDAEAKGILKPGSVIIEPTSGNTGLGLAVASAVRGYRCIIVMPEKMSDEKVLALKSLGAEIVRTRTEAAWNEPDSLICVAERLEKEIPNAIILNQYTNPGNPLAHYDGTGAEILDALDGQVDMVVIGAGTGGTVTGISRKIKEQVPNCKIVAVDPEGSILAQPESLNETNVNFYELEGIGYDFIPTVLDRSLVDKWIKVNDAISLPMARRLIKEEGILSGGSSGAALAAALQVAKELKEGQKCVVLFPDGIRNYMTKFMKDSWMEARNLKSVPDLEFWWWKLPVTSIHLSPAITVSPTTTCSEAISVMRNEHKDYLPIVSNKEIKGMVTMKNLLEVFVTKKLSPTDPVSKAIYKQFRSEDVSTTLGKISRILETQDFVLITRKQTIAGVTSTKEVPELVGTISQTDILNYIANAVSKAAGQNGQNGNSN